VTLSVPRLRIVSKAKRRASCRRKHTTPITTQAQLPLCSVCGQPRSKVPRASRSAHVLSKFVVELAGAQGNKTNSGNVDRQGIRIIQFKPSFLFCSKVKIV